LYFGTGRLSHDNVGGGHKFHPYTWNNCAKSGNWTYEISWNRCKNWCWYVDTFLGLAYQGKDLMFRFIIEYSSLRDFYRPLGNNNRSIFIWGFLKDDILVFNNWLIQFFNGWFASTNGWTFEGACECWSLLISVFNFQCLKPVIMQVFTHSSLPLKKKKIDHVI